MTRAADDMQTPLSERERQVAQAYADGESYRRIAERFFIAPATVRTHLASIYRKLGVSSKLELHKTLSGEDRPGRSTADPSALISELALSLEEAIARERALGEVLRIISRSNGEVSAVIEAVLEHALELCDAEFGILFSYDPRSGFMASHVKGIPAAFKEWLDRQGSFHVSPQTGLGRIAATCDVVNILDVQSEDIYRRGDPLRDATADLGGARSFTAIPMLVGETLIGAFTIYRQRVRPFDAKSLEIARMFADQSVIAIENARLMSAARLAVTEG